jgi:hypothetical protein
VQNALQGVAIGALGRIDPEAARPQAGRICLALDAVARIIGVVGHHPIPALLLDQILEDGGFVVAIDTCVELGARGAELLLQDEDGAEVEKFSDEAGWLTEWSGALNLTLVTRY